MLLQKKNYVDVCCIVLYMCKLFLCLLRMRNRILARSRSIKKEPDFVCTKFNNNKTIFTRIYTNYKKVILYQFILLPSSLYTFYYFVNIKAFKAFSSCTYVHVHICWQIVPDTIKNNCWTFFRLSKRYKNRYDNLN